MKKNFSLIVTFLIVSNSLFGNDGYAVYSPVSGALIGDSTDEIQMVRELVQYDGRVKKFRTEFVFRNLTEQTLRFATIFPFYSNPDGRSQFDIESHDFKTWVDGSVTESTYQKSLLPELSESEFDSVITENIEIKAFEEITVVHEYYEEPAKESGSNVGEKRFIYQYIARTGQSWANNIEYGKFQFILPTQTISRSIIRQPDQHIGLNSWYGIMSVDQDYSPQYPIVEYSADTVEVVWEFHDYDPDFDIEIDIDVIGTPSAMTSPDRASKYITQPTSGILELIEYDLKKFNLSNTEYLDMVYDWIEYHYEKYLAGEFEKDKEILSKSCRYYINYLYATRGYQFSSEDLLAGFRVFTWYSPINNPDLNFVGSIKEKLDKVIEIRNYLESQ